MAARLKVFTTTQGFLEIAVAATSQAKALEAWGTRQNLFAEGLARITTDEALTGPALAHPGELVTRPAHSDAALAEAVKAAPTRKADAGPAEASPRPSNVVQLRKPEKPKKPPDRTALTAAEAALAEFEAQAAAERETLEAERRRLEARIAKAEAATEKSLTRLKDKVDKARARFERR